MVTAPGEKTISIKMNSEFITRLDKIAEITKRTRHNIIKNLIEAGIDELGSVPYLPTLQLGVMVQDYRKALYGSYNGLAEDPVSGDRSIPITLNDDLVSRLDYLSSKAFLSRHQLMKNILRIGVEEGESLAKLGILKFLVLMRDLPKAIQNVCKKGERALKVDDK